MGVPGNLTLVKSNRQGRGNFRRVNTTRKEYTFKMNTSDTGSNLVYYEEVGNIHGHLSTTFMHDLNINFVENKR